MQNLLVSLGLVRQEMGRTFVPEGHRSVYINDPVKSRTCDYLHNGVTTAKYNTFTFLPRFLFEFFSKYANLFFLFTGSFQMVGTLSPTSKYGTILPLIVIGIFTAIKELLEDSKRHVQDFQVNNRICKVLEGTQFAPRKWSEIKIGDIVRIENSEFFPADLILLSSSEPDALCYIETSNLDGETNLKIRQGLQETVEFLTPESVAKLDATVKSELPNNSLYTFEATLRIGSHEYALSPQQLLLRGAQLRNTRWVYAIVVFTGHETKLMMNSTSTPVKSTKVEKMINEQIIFLFLCLIVIATLGALGQLITELYSPFFQKILLTGFPNQDGFISAAFFPNFPLNFITYMILFNNLIPLSLIVTLEMCKYAIGFFINNDLDMYYEHSHTPASARTSSLVEELGQIDFIFSDKTGTLTRNIMEFKMCSIGGVGYAEVVPDDKRLTKNEQGVEVGYYDFGRMQQHREKGANKFEIDLFLRILAVCHTVIPEQDENDPSKINFQASSPDEAALVEGARSLGKPRSVTIAVSGINYEYQILHVNEFNSTRKRMSVVVRCPDGSIQLMIKGADTVMFERLDQNFTEFKPQTEHNLEDYANDGLRTLVLAYRNISESEYKEWLPIYEKAATTVNNRQEALDKAAEMIEVRLRLLGATAIEDKLQEGVPDTIHTLMEAGIRVWVLTGDRQETAINIGFSCKLITPEMLMIVCNESTHYEVKEFLEQKLAAVKDSMVGVEQRMSKWERFWMGIGWATGKFDKDMVGDMDPMALVIDGKSLDFALEEDVKETFLELAMLCKAVVCCRVTPLQKALVVKLVKDNVAGAVTLAIGDGANDVSMIQAAHVGIGISGMEGLQAVRSSDFAIAQFRYLKKLLLTHGGWGYSRVCKVVVICFYKNITLYLIQFWFALNNNFSGMTLFETWSSVSSYNVIWTLLPPLAIGIFDQYVSARMLDRYPQMYKSGQNGAFYNHKIFIGWILNSFFHSLMLFYLWAWVLQDSDILSGGLVADNWAFGTMVYVTTIITVLIKHCLIVDSYVSFTAYAIFGSFGVFMIFFPLYSSLGPLFGASPELLGVSHAMFYCLPFWLSLIVFPIMINLRDIIWKYIRRQFFPENYHIVQEIQKFNIPDYRPRQEHFKKAVHKVRQIQRIKQTRGFAFSQNESGQAGLIRSYDTTLRKPKG